MIGCCSIPLDLGDGAGCLSLRASNRRSNRGNPPRIHGIQGAEFSRNLNRRFCMKSHDSATNQVPAILKTAEAGTPVPELCQEHGISGATFYAARQIRRDGCFPMTRAQGARGGNRVSRRCMPMSGLKAEIIQGLWQSGDAIPA